MTLYLLLVSFFAPLHVVRAQTTVSAEEQAARLQNIQSSLVANIPLASISSYQNSLRIGGQFLGAVPPKVNGTVGGKQENLPSPFLIGCPQIVLSYRHDVYFLKGWIGYVSKEMASLEKVDGEFNHHQLGSEFEYHLGQFAFNVGVSKTSSRYQGKISSTGDGRIDRFESKSQIFYISSGYNFVSINAWSNFQIGIINNESKLMIEEDGTTIVLKDRLSDSFLPYFYALNFGKNWNQSSLSISELIIPKRLAMVRFSVSYAIDIL